jgi:hypothetical protein
MERAIMLLLGKNIRRGFMRIYYKYIILIITLEFLFYFLDILTHGIYMI